MKLFVTLALVAFVGCSLVEGHTLFARDTKAELITKGNDLVKKADEAIKKLEADKKTHELALVKHEEEHLKKLLTDLEAATEATGITHIEHELARTETRLAHVLEAIEKGTAIGPHTPGQEPHTPAKRATKAELITKGNDLIKKADEAIVKLEADKKTHEVTVIKSEEAKIKKLIADLEAATDDAKVKQLEHELEMAERQLEHQLQRMNHVPVPMEPHTPTKRATKAELITKGNDLIKKADEAIVKLEADKKTHEVTVIKSEEAKIKKLIADLEAATDDAKVKQLEHELEMAEHQLEHQLVRVNHVQPVPPTF